MIVLFMKVCILNNLEVKKESRCMYMEKLSPNELRNVMIPLAVAKPNLYKKLGVIGLITFYIMLVISFLSSGFLTNYIYIEISLIVLLLIILSHFYDNIYRTLYMSAIEEGDIGVVIGYSNKLVILAGDDVVDIYETDKIKIRQVTNEESDTFYQKYSSIIECFKNNEKIGQICVAKVGNFDGLTLTADMSRANEDIEIVYDDEDDFDDSDEDFEDDDSEDDDLGDFDDNAQK